jgi:DNA-binding MarR family transcriptional regulator
MGDYQLLAIPYYQAVEPPPTLLGITTFVLHKVGITNRRAVADRLTAEAGVGLWQFAVLSALSDFGPSAQRDVGDRLGLDPSDLVRLMDELLQAGLIDRVREPEDRRRYRISLTPAGRATLRTAKGTVAKAEQDALAPLTEAERARLHELVVKVFAHRPGGQPG